MIPIIEERRKPSFREQLMGGLGKVAESASTQIPALFAQQLAATQENEAIKRLTGQDVSGLSPEMKKSFFDQLMKGETAAQQKSTSFDTALNAINSIEEMLGQPGIGLTGIINPSSKARFNRGEFESRVAAILPLFKSLFPRGFTEKEFKVIRENYLPNSTDTEERIKGKLKGLRDLVESASSGKSVKPQKIAIEGKEKFDVSNPEHKAKRDQLMKKFKGNRKKVEEALDREFE